MDESCCYPAAMFPQRSDAPTRGLDRVRVEKAGEGGGSKPPSSGNSSSSSGAGLSDDGAGNVLRGGCRDLEIPVFCSRSVGEIDVSCCRKSAV